MELAGFALGKWGSTHTGTGICHSELEKTLKIKNGNGIWELRSGIWKNIPISQFIPPFRTFFVVAAAKIWTFQPVLEGEVGYSIMLMWRLCIRCRFLVKSQQICSRFWVTKQNLKEKLQKAVDIGFVVISPEHFPSH